MKTLENNPMTYIAIQLPDGIYLQAANPYPKQKVIEFEPRIWNLNPDWKEFNDSHPPHIALFPIAVGERVEESEVKPIWQFFGSDETGLNDIWISAYESEYNEYNWAEWRKLHQLEGIDTRQAFIRIPAKEEQKDMEKKFTPGPWFPVEYAGQYNLNDEPYYEGKSVLSVDDVGREYAEANANLAASAPELLAALEEMLESCYTLMGSDLRNKAKQAILKAHGK